MATEQNDRDTDITVLKHIRDTWTPDGYCMHTYARDSRSRRVSPISDKAVRRCILGAIYQALGTKPITDDGLRISRHLVTTAWGIYATAPGLATINDVYGYADTYALVVKTIDRLETIERLEQKVL